MNKEKKLYLYVGVVCAREAYQGEEHMQESEAVPFTMTEKAEIMLKEKESLFLT